MPGLRLDDHPSSIADPDGIQRHLDSTFALIDRMAAALAERPFLAGDRDTLADAFATAALARFTRHGFADRWAETPMHGYYARMKARPSFAEAELAADDPALVAAFDAKIAKETAARRFVATPDDMRAAAAATVQIVADLEDRLDPSGPWRFGARFTLADVVWSVSLFRLKWLGMALCWTGGHRLNERPRPRVEAYAERLFRRPSFRAAIIDWPLTPKTEFVEAHYARS